MKKLVPFILLFIAACSNVDQCDQSTVRDSIPLLFDSAMFSDSVKLRIFAEKARVAINNDSVLSAKNIQLDTLLKYAEIYKDNIDSLKQINKKINLIIARNTFAIDSIQVLKAENIKLKIKNVIISSNLNTEKQKGIKVEKERNELREKIENASKFILEKVEIKAYRINAFGSAIETNKANKVKRVEVSFKIPSNKLFTLKTYTIKAIVHGITGNPNEVGIKDSVVIKYNGNEQERVIPFNQKIEWRPINHLVQIFSGKELLYSGTLILK